MSKSNSGSSQMMIFAIVVCFCLFISSIVTGVLMFNKSKSSSSEPSSSSSSEPSSSSSSEPTSSSSSKPVYEKVGTVGECVGPAYYVSNAWSTDLIDSNDPKTTTAEFGDTRYNTWVDRATDICTTDPQCNAFSVWRDGGYRKYEACDSASADPSYRTFANSFKNKTPKPLKTLTDPPSGSNVYKRIKIAGTVDNVNMCASDNDKGSRIINDDNKDSNLCRWNYDPVTQQLKNKQSGYCININMDGNSSDLVQWTCDADLISSKFKYNPSTKTYESIKKPGNVITNTGWQSKTSMMVYPDSKIATNTAWETAWYS